MRNRQPFALFLKVLLTLECVLLLAPATLFSLMAGVVALGSLLPFSNHDYGPWHWRLQALVLFMVPFVFGTVAVVEIGRIVVAVLQEKAFIYSQRTLFSAVSGGAATISGGVSFYVVGKDQTTLGAATVALVLVGPVILLCGHLWWLQVRLRRIASPF